ncbi:flagellar filament capping protein FliD [Anaerospora hongkongensis]|uniref:flagellar filament capping protein FliD n=1 Tax=Anaerospora hongkongensis TaxID=244830 RepID=UPI002FDB81DB
MVMRTYGLSGSGMDIDQMVKDLMKARRASYDKVWQKKTQVEWKKQDINTIYTLAEDFRNKTIADFKKQTTLSPKQVTSTNETVASATANADAANVSHSLIVQQLADGVKLSSSDSITDTANGRTKGTLIQQFGYAAGDSFSLSINGKTVKVDVTETTTLNDVVSSINKAGADVKANYDATLDRFYLYSNKTGSAAVVNFNGSDSKGMDFLFDKLKIGSSSTNLSSLGMTSQRAADASTGATSVEDAFGITAAFNVTVKKTAPDGTVTPYNVAVNPTDTIDSLLTKLNDDLGAGAAAFDAATGRITIKSVDINNGWSVEGLEKFGMKQLVQNGQDAIINLDGVALRQSSNSFTVSGVTYTLKSTSFVDSANNPIPTNIGVQPDVDKTIANVQSFVDSYNTFMALIQKELKEDKYSDFAPLTDAQKADMKDSEIKAWEEKAKSGSLRRDPILTQMVSNMRMSLTDPIKGLSGKYQSAIDIGIGTGKYFDSDGNLTTEATNGGKLYVDEDTMRKALEEDPDAVFKIFGTPGDTQSTEGVANRLYDQMYSSLSRLKTEAGTPNSTDTTSNLAKSIASYKDQLYDMSDRLSQVEARYYKQFDAMETALNNLSKQSSWLSQQLGQ